jgi:polyhydroxybutyrate depolymerase
MRSPLAGWFLLPLTTLGLFACRRTVAVQASAPPATAPISATALLAGENAPASQTVVRTLDDRSYRLHVGATVDGSRPAPLIIAIHGYSGDAEGVESYLSLDPIADAQGLILAYPEGTKDPRGNRFFAATDACCNFFGAKVDDDAFIMDVIHDVEKTTTIDPKRVFVVGISNGGFMAQRLACDHADVIAAAVSIAGALYKDTSLCKPSQPVAFLEIHADGDPVVPYAGGQLAPTALPIPALVPSSEASVAFWARTDKCPATGDPGKSLDFADGVAGAETQVERFEPCADGTAVELWTIHANDHLVDLSASAPNNIWWFMAGHARS